jgi:xanthine dehydrogenase accessory factor
MPAADHDRIPETALAWHQAGEGAAIATVIETWGSAPRPAGSQMAVSGTGAMMGSVSGGCVEGAVVEEARASLTDGESRVLTYGVSDDDAFAVGLACGGTIRVLVEPVGKGIPVAMLEDLAAARAQRAAVAYVVNMETWERNLAPLGGDLEARFRADRSGVEGAEFVAIHNPPLRMVIVGAVHIAQGLAGMAAACGYDVWLIDPRDAFGSQARFPGQRVLNEWPDEAMAQVGIDARTAVVTLTHDAKLDDPAIRAALASECFYLGCLGSKRTHAKRLERMADLPADAVARIHAPVGLDIGAMSPAEIAVSIMAQITQVLRRG